jgi:hypothetical protein
MQLVESAAASRLSSRTTLSRASFSDGLPVAGKWRGGRLDPRRFGRSGLAHAAEPCAVATTSPIARNGGFGSALGLFAVTFLAGFLFVSILLV